MVKIGVLAIQGAFDKHVEALKKLGVTTYLVRKKKDFDGISGLILPGGESTVLKKGIVFSGIIDSLNQFAEKKPVFGTCAGLILMSQKIKSEAMKPFGWLDVTVERNAYGRQADSFFTEINVQLKTLSREPAFFIRAPRIVEWKESVEVLARQGDDPVLVRQHHFLGATYHPELTESLNIHQYFVDLVKAKA